MKNKFNKFQVRYLLHVFVGKSYKLLVTWSMNYAIILKPSLDFSDMVFFSFYQYRTISALYIFLHQTKIRFPEFKNWMMMKKVIAIGSGNNVTKLNQFQPYKAFSIFTRSSTFKVKTVPMIPFSQRKFQIFKSVRCQ